MNRALLGLTALWAMGCAARHGSTPAPPAPEAAPDTRTGADSAHETESDGFAEPAPGQAPGYGQSQPAEDQLDLSSMTAAQALDVFNQSASRLSAGADCRTACRALDSMRRAKERICSLSQDQPERCESARERLDRAERHVSSRCLCPTTP